MAPPPITLRGIDQGLLPRSVSAPIFEQARTSSAVMRLARRVSTSLTGVTIPVTTGLPVAGWIDEGQRKPVTTETLGVRKLTPKKVAAIVPLSMETVRVNPAGIYDAISPDLAMAIALAFDLAALHGRTITGDPGPFPDFIAKTPHRVTLGTTPQHRGGIYGDLVTGEGMVIESEYDVTGYVADPRLKTRARLATDTTGRPLVGFNGSTETLLDSPIAYSRAVSGKFRKIAGTTDTRVRAYAGDWTQAAYGVGFDIEISTSTEASWTGEDGLLHSAFEENMILIRAEASFGFVLGDAEAFVAYTEPAS